MKNVVNRLAQIMGAIAAVVTALLCVTVLADVIARNLFNQPIPGALELVQYWWMVALVWCGVPVAQVLDEHLRVTLLPGALGHLGENVVTGIAHLLGAVCGAFLLFPAWEAALGAAESGQAVVSSVSVPIWPATFFVVVGIALFIAVCLVQFVTCVRELIFREENNVY